MILGRPANQKAAAIAGMLVDVFKEKADDHREIVRLVTAHRGGRGRGRGFTDMWLDYIPNMPKNTDNMCQSTGGH